MNQTTYVCHNRFNFQDQRPTCIVDHDVRFTHFSDVGAVYHGYKNAGHIAGTSMFDLKCDIVQFAPDLHAQFKDVLQHEHEITLLDIVNWADGQKRMVLTKKYPLYNDAGELAGGGAHVEELSGNIAESIFKTIFLQKNSFLHPDALSNVSHQLIDTLPKLSVRESECFYFILRGKSLNAISQILKLSVRTVESYVNTLRHKLQCETKSDLIGYGVAHRLTHLIPNSLLR